MGWSPCSSILGAANGICCSQPTEPLRSEEAWPVSLERQVLFWGVAAAALLYLLHLLGSAITPFAAGIALGYLLDPVVLKLQRLGLNRLGASLVILVAFALAVVIVLILVVPILANQFIVFSERLPSYAMRLQALAVEEGNGLIAKYRGPWLDALGLKAQISSEQIQKSVGDFVAQGAQWLLRGVRSVVSGGAAVFNFLSLLIITPVVAFYILVDWKRMISEIDSWLPLDHRDSLRKIAGEMNDALAGYIRGQSLVCIFLGVWYSLGLTLIGLDFGFLIGVLAGLLSFVPYVGSLTALALSLGVALVQGWPNLTLFFLALGVVGVGQFLEGNVLSPKLVGESIGLHPVWLMFALLAFGELFGFLGLLIAVPTAAAIGVVSRHLIALYLKSPLYRGRSTAEGQ
jgi:predicted PurR-regulated permease PerM